MTHTTETNWQGQKAVTLDNEYLQVVVLPEMGAKLASILYKPTNQEWMVLPAANSLRPLVYGDTFTKYTIFGWDEMFPTITACLYPAPGAFAGRMMPDHGEVWSLAWQRDEAENGLALSVEGRAVPYRLSRLTTLDGKRLVLDYHLTNTGSEPLVWLWASHPQFTVTPLTELVLPPEVQTVINVIKGTALGDSHQRHSWPISTGADGKPLALNRIGDASLHTFRKFYIEPECHPAWAMLRKPETGDWLQVGWEADKAPYLGLWFDEGAVNSVATMAIEASSGYYDSLAGAWERQMTPILAASASCSWQMMVELGAD